jgi:hypothetical protein
VNSVTTISKPLFRQALSINHGGCDVARDELRPRLQSSGEFYFGSDQVLVNSLLAQERGVYLCFCGVRISAYAISVLFPSASYAPSFCFAGPLLCHVGTTVGGQPPGSANYAGGLLEPLGDQLCRKADPNLEKENWGESLA